MTLSSISRSITADLNALRLTAQAVLVNLAKNPVGANMTLRVMNEQAGFKRTAFCP